MRRNLDKEIGRGSMQGKQARILTRESGKEWEIRSDNRKQKKESQQESYELGMDWEPDRKARNLGKKVGRGIRTGNEQEY